MKWIKRIFFILCCVGGIALIRDTAHCGHDFWVFWRAALDVRQGFPLYSIARDGGMSFKYPPWLIPFFIPFSFLPLVVAKWIWGAVEVFSLVLVLVWLVKRQKCHWFRCGVVLLSYWGLWAVHALDGQIVLPMLACALWFWRFPPFEKFNFRTVGLMIALSVKIFSLFPLFLSVWNKKFFKTFIQVGGVLVFLSIPAWWVSPRHDLGEFLYSWVESAASGGKLLTSEQVRGRGNPGLPGLVLRILQVPAENTHADLLVVVCLLGLFAGIWKFCARYMTKQDAWVGALALVPVLHPLPWWHLFVFSFPLSVLAFERAWRMKRIRLILCVIVGVALITTSSEKFWGSLGIILEQCSAKSWGVLLCTASWVLINFSLSRRASTM